MARCLLCSTALPWPESGFYLTDLCNSDGTEKCPSNPEANPEAKLQQPRLRARSHFCELKPGALLFFSLCCGVVLARSKKTD